jgi:photosystem II stability/assembly factor-like uncharacterized protein
LTYRLDGHQSTNFKEIVVHPDNPDIAYVGVNNWRFPGLQKTVDGGQSWQRVTLNAGSGENMDYGWITKWGPAVKSLTLCRSNPDYLYFGTPGHVFASQDAGVSWTQRYGEVLPDDGHIKGNGLETTVLVDAAFDPVDSRRVYLYYLDIGLLVSDDLGETFELSTKGRLKGSIGDVVIDPDDSNKIWMVMGNRVSGNGYVYRSLDGGESWQLISATGNGLPKGRIKRILLDPVSPLGERTLYITCLGQGIFKSVDGGLSWHPVNLGLPEKARQHIVDLIMNPNDSNHLRSLSGPNPSEGSGIYETEDGGMTWIRISGPEEPFADVKDLAVDPHDWNTLYIAQKQRFIRPVTYPGGLYKSTDGGETWTMVYRFHAVSSVSVSPANSSMIYLGTTNHPHSDTFGGQGLLKSSDGGQTWQSIAGNLTTDKITSISISPHDPSLIIVGTSGNGAFIGQDSLSIP